MTTRSYETEVYASPGDGGTVRGIAYATTIDQSGFPVDRRVWTVTL